MKLCLGTVQFGMPYGLNGKLPPKIKQSLSFMDYAVHNGITSIDTAEAYGEAERIVGLFIQNKTIERSKLSICTKLLPNCLDGYEENEYYGIIRKHLISSLKRLNLDYVDSFLLHSAKYVDNQAIVDALYRMKKEGLANKVGASVYDPEEVVHCLKNKKIEIVQAPYSLFDHRLKEARVFDLVTQSKCILNTRSAFLQGLINMHEDDVPKHLRGATDVLKKIDQLCVDNKISRVELALAYVRREKSISELVFGIHSMEQLKENINCFKKNIPEDVLRMAEKEIGRLERNLVVPSLWAKSRNSGERE